MSDATLALLAVWGLWCALHSLLIANAVTGFFQRLLGRTFRIYRAAYGLFSAVTLVPLILLTQSTDRSIVLAWEGLERLVPAAGLGLAALLFILGARHYELAELLGLRQLAGGIAHRALSRENRLDTSGILGVVRHPWYTATFLLLWSRELTRAWILVNAVLSVYLVVGTLLEERKLIEEFGDDYREYRKRVSMFFPLKWLIARLSRAGGER